jgi:uncharacterized membrane protein
MPRQFLNSDSSKSSASHPKDWTASLLWCAVVIVVVVFVIVVSLYIGHFGKEWPKEADGWGQFGDYIGGVMNPLIGLITLVGLAFTLRLQRQILRETKDESRNQREDEWFFQLLNLRSVVISNLSAPKPSGSEKVMASGSECFEVWANDLRHEHLRDLELGNDCEKSPEQQFHEASQNLIARNTNTLRPYLKFMAEFLTQIHAGHSKQQVGNRLSLVASQIGESEATLLGCFGLAEGSKEFGEHLKHLGVVGQSLMTQDRYFHESFHGTTISSYPGGAYDQLMEHLKQKFGRDCLNTASA